MTAAVPEPTGQPDRPACDCWPFMLNNGDVTHQRTCATRLVAPAPAAEPTGPSCTTMGHEHLAATHVGRYDDGQTVEDGVAYCAECAMVMRGEFTPGLARHLTPAQRLADALAQVAALRADVERLTAERDRAAVERDEHYIRADEVEVQRDAARAEVAALRARQDADLDRVCEAAFGHSFETEDWETAPEYIRERWRKALRAALQGGTA